MYKIDSKVRLRAVEYYLKNSTTLKKTAAKFNVHYQSLFKWVRLYKNQGEERLLLTYKKPWNRFSPELENRIVLLKEKDPTLTIRKARELFVQKGIKVSIKGIWGVWRRYGYVGFRKERLCPDFTEYCVWTKEATQRFAQANALFRRGKQKLCAKILNSIPMLPRNDIVTKIPDSLLNLRRRLEKMAYLYRRIPVRSYFETLKNLYTECKKKGFNYQSLRVKLFEAGALSFAGDPASQLKSSHELKKSLERRGNYLSPLLFPFEFPTLVSEGIAHAQLSEIRKAENISRYCCTLIKRRKNISDSFVYELGALCTWTEDFKKAEYCFSRALDKTKEDEKEPHKRNLGFVLFYKGDYKRGLRYLTSIRERGWGYDPKVLMCQAIWSLVNGMPEESISLCTEALSQSKKGELNIGIIMAYFRIACAYCGLGKRTKAMTIIKRLLPFAQRNFRRIVDMFEYVVSPKVKSHNEKKSTKDILPSVRLIQFLKDGNYAQAYSYAKRKYLMSHFHQYILLFPEVVINQLDKGRTTYLPKSMLGLPVFNPQVPVYNMKFLGNLIVYKNDKYMKINLPPKQTAFVIQLSLKVGEPGKRIYLRDLNQNFWKGSANPARNFSHLMTKLKKALKIPGHLFEVFDRKGDAVLVNRGIHFMTDYNEVMQIFATAHAFMRAGEWEYARREYLRAFVLFRDQPFRKMYDDWSEAVRQAVLNKLESEATKFTKACFDHKDTRDIRRVLERVAKIMPHSRKIEDMLETGITH